MNRANAPAFPRPTSTGPSGHYLPQDGLTLREYLTGQAVIGVMALNAGGNPDYELIAAHAVALADLTLIALTDVTHEDTLNRISETVTMVKAEQESWNAQHVKAAEQEQKDEKEPASAALPAAAGPTSVPEGKPAKTDEETSKDPSAAKKPAADAEKTDAKKTRKTKT